MEKHRLENPSSDDEKTLVLGEHKEDFVVESPTGVPGFEEAANDVLTKPPPPLPAPATAGVNMLPM